MTKLTLTAPIPGVFFRRPSPDAECFAEENDVIEIGKTLGVVEVMKAFQAIIAEQPGRFVRYLVEDDEMVMPGDPICEIEV